MVLQNNEVLCPKCLTKIEVCPSDNDYDEDPMIYCEDCDVDFEGIVASEKDFWYEINMSNFAIEFLKLRGYTGEPKSWYAVSCYLKNFMDGDRKIPNSWKDDEDFDNAYLIVNKYFDVELDES